MSPTPTPDRGTGDSRIERLAEEIRRHRQLYYQARPEITDLEFDALEDELRSLAPSHPVLSEVGAPAVPFQGVGLPTKRHRIPMGSLEKIPEERLDAWAEKAGPLFLVQEKLDGISLEIEYSRGRMVDAITRGDGLVGEVVTHNAIHFQNVKTRLEVPFTGSVRAEVLLRRSVFEEHFVGADFANPRNSVSGTVRKKHGDLSLNRYLELHFYDVIADRREFSTEREKMEFLRDELELELAATYFDRSVTEVRAIYREYLGEGEGVGKRSSLDYEIDGLVVRADSLERQRALGVLRNRPRYAMAYKFPSVGETTVLRDVDWSLGIGGRVTPVARLEPVQVGGVTVANATLHNPDYLEALGVTIGDLVLVERKGDVIPQVVRVVEARGGAKPAPPEACPSCGAGLEMSGKHLRCPDRGCPGKSYGDLARWITAMEIDSVGEKWIEILIGSGLVSDPVGLYRLTVEELLPLERMGKTLAAKIVRNIQKSRRPTLDQFVAALNIPEFSRQRVQVLMQAGYDTLEKLRTATVEELTAVKGFGEILAKKAVLGLQARSARVEALLEAGIRIREETPAPGEKGPLAGRTFCFTGAVSTTDPDTGKPYTRKRLQELVVEKGGRALSDVSSQLDYLVLADPNSRSSKAKKARKLETQILSEQGFFELLAGGILDTGEAGGP